MPGSPKTVTRLERRSRIVRASAFSSSSSSCSRPMNQAFATPRCASSERIARHVQSGSVAALDLDRAGVLDLDRACGEPAHDRPEHDLARLRRLLQARGQVDGLAGGEGRRGGVVDDDLAGLDADARLEPELAHLLHHREGGAERALGVVLVRARNAERGHHRVAGELLDRAAVLLDAGRGLIEVLAHAAPDDLGIDSAHEGRRVDQVDEEHRRELPFHPSIVGTGALPAETDFSAR